MTKLKGKEKEVIDLYILKKYTTIKISELLNVGVGVVLRILHNNNIQMRKSDVFEKINKKSHDIANSKNEKILQLYKDGMSIDKISNILKTSDVKISKLLKENNIEIRPRSYYLKDEKNPAWRGGGVRYKTFKKQYNVTKYQWDKIAKNVLKRDNYICQKCGNEKNLQVHHIIPAIFVNDMAKNDYENLITLCNSCHHKVESVWYDYVEPFRNYLTKQHGYKNYPVDFYKAMELAEIV